jgi:hypothetical protein
LTIYKDRIWRPVPTEAESVLMIENAEKNEAGTKHRLSLADPAVSM